MGGLGLQFKTLIFVNISNELCQSIQTYFLCLFTFRAHMKLTIKNLSGGDFGNYRCISKNSLGETEGSIRVYGMFSIENLSSCLSIIFYLWIFFLLFSLLFIYLKNIPHNWLGWNTWYSCRVLMQAEIPLPSTPPSKVTHTVESKEGKWKILSTYGWRFIFAKYKKMWKNTLKMLSTPYILLFLYDESKMIKQSFRIKERAINNSAFSMSLNCFSIGVF